MISPILILIVFTSIIFGQNNLPELDSSFVSSKLIKGVPILLEKNDYFSQPKKISYAEIYHDQNDSVYFVSKQLTADSDSYVLVLTSDKKIMGYKFLKLKKTTENKLYTIGEIEKTNENTFVVELYYIPKDNIISYRLKIENNSVQDISTLAMDSLRKHNLFYGEFLGSGNFLSLNYEREILNNFNLRFGIVILIINSESNSGSHTDIGEVPIIMLSYFINIYGNNFITSAVGAVTNGGGFFPYYSAGYSYNSQYGGLFLKFTVNIISVRPDYYITWPGIGVGISF